MYKAVAIPEKYVGRDATVSEIESLMNAVSEKYGSRYEVVQLLPDSSHILLKEKPVTRADKEA